MASFPALSPLARQRLLFAILCFVWGTTWLAMKLGISVVPPAFFSGVRWTVAGVVLLAWRHFHGEPVLLTPRLLPRVLLLAFLMISLTSTIQLYGVREMSSGLASVISAALTPLGLLGFAVALRQERPGWHQAAAIATGILGILLLFGPGAITGRLDTAEVLGAVAVAFSTLLYCVGSVLARPVMRALPPVQLAGLTNLLGGLALLVLSLPFEPGAWEAAGFAWGWAAWLGWLWLVLPGSLGASVIYFLLVRDWGASRAGTYAFISPVIAVVLGVVLLGEKIDALQAVGMGLMLCGAGMALRRTA
ncbi:Permease of the drug/metabolite transporter (DMT) superfamily [Rhodovastum atsumiense]|uniref:EamA family transporter n=1 Tax=Rhodovastum atsumiense TaxID=504468 RepID=A0A5M6IQC4_9PROT|nr:EamA family transporter [Rhodovastum atsumiense]KAA5610476.1 EamA family transporter [Rhodovastum atsumiense]CAH2600461.1 Permease of the drug/metabolite transporter (DMT) superfamily [Rhodovastum atsumiense]